MGVMVGGACPGPQLGGRRPRLDFQVSRLLVLGLFQSLLPPPGPVPGDSSVGVGIAVVAWGVRRERDGEQGRGQPAPFFLTHVPPPGSDRSALSAAPLKPWLISLLTLWWEMQEKMPVRKDGQWQKYPARGRADLKGLCPGHTCIHSLLC